MIVDSAEDQLPRFGDASEQATVPRGRSNAEQRRRPLSPRQRRWIVWGYLLISLCNAALALLGADDWLFHAIIAVLFALSAVAFLLGYPQNSARTRKAAIDSFL